MNKEESKLAFEKTFAIEWGDMDALGHVNNGRYFDYFQQARIDWMQQMNLNLTSEQGPVLVQIGCTFLKPVVYPATLRLTTRLHSPGRSSFKIDHEIFQGEQLMAQGESKLVWVDYKRNQSVPLPSVIRELFAE